MPIEFNYNPETKIIKTEMQENELWKSSLMDQLGLTQTQFENIMKQFNKIMLQFNFTKLYIHDAEKLYSDEFDHWNEPIDDDMLRFSVSTQRNSEIGIIEIFLNIDDRLVYGGSWQSCHL